MTSAFGVPVVSGRGGLLFAGLIIPVPGVNVIGTHDAAWAHLSPGDGVPRKAWPTQVILHKTLADDPERVTPNRGPLPIGVTRHAERTARFWQEDPKHSGAHIVVDEYGAACLADLVNFEAWHGNQSNDRSIGIEMCEEPGGIVRESTLANTVAICLAISEHCGIQLQVPTLDSYHEGQPLKRFADGGRTLVGFFGHRDVTTQRGKWDPGEQIWRRLVVAGAETFDFAAGQDRLVWRSRQAELNARGHNLVPDGIPGPNTTAALLKDGYRGGVRALGRG